MKSVIALLFGLLIISAVLFAAEAGHRYGGNKNL
jgi:hypothetical protein